MHPSRPNTNATFFMNTFLIFDQIGSHLFLLSTSIVAYYPYIYIFSLNMYLINTYSVPRTFPGGSEIKNLPAMQEMQVLSLGREDTLEKGMEAHSSILIWEIPMDRESCQVIVHGVTKESDTT